MKMKKLAALALAAVMTMGMATTALAQTQPQTTPDKDNASITISNASKGVTYAVYQLFDATVTGTPNGSISYQLMEGKDAPEYYFDVDDSGNVSAKATTNETVLKSSEFHAWAASYGTQVAEVMSDGTALTFTGLPYGYYYVTTTQGANVTVDSTNPDASIYDKNSTEPVIPEDAKKADNDNVSVGETVTYTVEFTTANYDGAGETAEKIVSYTIKDTLPDWLSDVNVTSIIVDEDADLETSTDQHVFTDQFDSNKQITIDWVDTTTKASLYKNGAKIVVTYTAVVNAGVTVGSENGNVNTVTISWDTENTSSKGSETSSETIYTYALAIQKVDEEGKNLPGATFQISGINYVTGSAGHYKVALQTTPDAIEATELRCDSNGYLVVEGVAAGDYTVTEVNAPDGYNKLTYSPTVTAQTIKSITSTTTTTVWKDANGNIVAENTEGATEEEVVVNELEATALKVLNQKGAELPSTGGIGTTIFYVVGGILVLGAGVVLVAKKRMNHEA